MNRFLDILSKYQKYFLGLAIFLALTSVSITISSGQVKMNLGNYPLAIIFLICLSIFLALIYIGIDKQKIKLLSREIKDSSFQENNDFNSSLRLLTSRQKEIYDLIIDGKSNKEIMSLLFIEQSTLKTHINQLYKKLKIKSRKDLKAKSSIE